MTLLRAPDAQWNFVGMQIGCQARLVESKTKWSVGLAEISYPKLSDSARIFHRNSVLSYTTVSTAPSPSGRGSLDTASECAFQIAPDVSRQEICTSISKLTATLPKVRPMAGGDRSAAQTSAAPWHEEPIRGKATLPILSLGSSLGRAVKDTVLPKTPNRALHMDRCCRTHSAKWSAPLSGFGRFHALQKCRSL